MPFWCCAQLKPQRAQVAMHFLGVAGFQTYYPQTQERVIRQGRRTTKAAPLFPGYTFVLIELQWTPVMYTPGVLRVITNGDRPAHVADRVIDDIKARERDGYIVLPKRQLRQGTPVRILQGVFTDHVGLYGGQAPRERVTVLLRILGAQQRVELPADHVEQVPGDELDGQWSHAQLLRMDAKFSERMRHASDNEKCGEPIGALIARLRI